MDFAPELIGLDDMDDSIKNFFYKVDLDM